MIIANFVHNQKVLIFDRHRPKSSLSRGGARTPSTTVKSIEEMDENAPEEAQTDKPAPSGEDKAPVDEQSLKVTEDALKEVFTLVVYFFRLFILNTQHSNVHPVNSHSNLFNFSLLIQFNDLIFL